MSHTSPWFSWPWNSGRHTRLTPSESNRLFEGPGAARKFLRYVANCACTLEENQYDGALCSAGCTLAGAGDVEEAMAAAARISDRCVREIVLSKIATAHAQAGRVERALEMIKGLQLKQMHLSRLMYRLARLGRLDYAFIVADALPEGPERDLSETLIADEAVRAGHAAEFLALAQQVDRDKYPLLFQDLCISLAKSGRLEQSVMAGSLVRDDWGRVLAFGEAGRAFKARGNLRMFSEAVQGIRDSCVRDAALAGTVSLLAEDGDLEGAVLHASLISPGFSGRWLFPGPALDEKQLSENTISWAENIGNPVVREDFLSGVAFSMVHCGRAGDFAAAAERCSTLTRDLGFAALARELAAAEEFDRAEQIGSRLVDEKLRKRSRDLVTSARRKAERLTREPPTQVIEGLARDISENNPPDSAFRVAELVNFYSKRGDFNAAKDAMGLVNLALEGSIARSVGGSLARRENLDLLYQLLPIIKEPRDRARALEGAAVALARAGNLKAMHECVSRIEESTDLESAIAHLAHWFVHSRSTDSLLPEIARLGDSQFRDRFRIAVARTLMYAGQFGAARDFFVQVEDAREKHKALAEETASLVRAAGSSSNQEAMTLAAEMNQETREDFLDKLATHETVRMMEDMILGSLELNRLRKSQPRLTFAMLELLRAGETNEAFKLASGLKDAQERADFLTVIAERLSLTGGCERVRQVLSEAVRTCGQIGDRGAKALRLLFIAAVIASRKTDLGGREAKPQVDAEDKTLVLDVLRHLHV